MPVPTPLAPNHALPIDWKPVHPCALPFAPTSQPIL